MKLLSVVPALAPSRARHLFLPLVSGVLVLCPACVTTPPSTPDTALAPAPRLLAEGRPVERILAGGETHEHRLAVEAGWYVRLEVEQAGVDVAARLLGPDGAALFSADDPDGLEDREVLAVIAPAAGELRLLLTPADPQSAPGAYRVTLAARRPAGPGDPERAAAQKAYAEAGRWLGLRDEKRGEAIPLLQEAARLWGAAGEAGTQAATLNELGVVQNGLSDMQAALASFREALAVSRKAGDLSGEAFAHSNLAASSVVLEDAEKLEHYRQALALFQTLGNLSEQGRVLYGLGIFHRDRGDFDAALRYLSEALPLRQAAKDARGELYTRLALAIVHQGRGEMQLASEDLERARELGDSGGWADQGFMLTTMAQFHRYRGELGEALVCLQKARESYQREGDESYEVRVLHQLGNLYLDLGDLEGAQRSFEEGLALIQGKSPNEARFLNSLGWVLYVRGDAQTALGYFGRALTLSRQKEFATGITKALGQTGSVYVTLGRAREGLSLLQKERVLHRTNGDRLEEAKSLLEIGRAHQALGDLDQATASFREALDLGRRVGNTGLQATCLYRWAALDRQRGALEEARGRVEEALRMIESVRSRVSGEKLRITYLASKRSWYELYVDLLMRLEERQPGQGHAAAALEASERARARGLLDLIAEGRIVQEGIAPELKRRETELGARLFWIQERLAEVDPESGEASELNARLDRVGEELEQLEQEVRRRYPQYAEVRYPTPLRLEQIEGLLDGRTALLEYFAGREASFLFVVTRSGLSAHRLPAAEVLEKKVQDLRSALERPGLLTLSRFRMAAGDLYDVLLGPAADRLAQTPNLLISPDGALSLVPFETLLADPRQGDSYRTLGYLLRDHSVSYVPSASVLQSLRELRPPPAAGAPAAKELVAFGDPVYPAAQVAAQPLRNSVNLGTAPPLPGSGREVTAIARLYPDSEVALYLGEQATEENVKANPLLQTARRIHFATHGVLNESHPQLSGLLMTRDPAFPEEDGVLRVFEIFNLRLNADLVTLSACETGLGRQVTGEGMVGLTRAFLYAGARSLLVSLWQVSDRSTPDLMMAFYRHLGDMGTKTEALRRAKLERIEEGDEPYRWSPFILGGDPH